MTSFLALCEESILPRRRLQAEHVGDDRPASTMRPKPIRTISGVKKQDKISDKMKKR